MADTLAPAAGLEAASVVAAADNLSLDDVHEMLCKLNEPEPSAAAAAGRAPASSSAVS